MADAAQLEADDEVLEIGPGLGVLTRVLLSRAGRVVAVELDPKLAALLPSLTPQGRLEVVQQDALRFEPADHFEGDYKLIANLPYQITSPVLHRYLLAVRRPVRLALMVQREVAARITAGPGQASYLSNLVQSVAEVRIVRQVPAGAFFPRPNVSSAVVLIEPRPATADSDRPTALVALLRLGFTQPRKTLANSLAQGLGRPRTEVAARLTASGIDPNCRPQELSVAEWRRLLERGDLAASSG